VEHLLKKYADLSYDNEKPLNRAYQARKDAICQGCQEGSHAVLQYNKIIKLLIMHEYEMNKKNNFSLLKQECRRISSLEEWINTVYKNSTFFKELFKS